MGEALYLVARDAIKQESNAADFSQEYIFRIVPRGAHQEMKD
jgi:hypothetical protein